MPEPPKLETIPKQTALTIVLVFVLLAGLPQIPALHQLGGFQMNQLLTLVRIPATAPPIAATPAHTAARAPSNLAKPFPTQTSPDLLDPAGALDHFYDALARTAAKEPGAVTRILHFGDSPVTADSITADARAMMQAKFGDAGHGFLLIAKPWAWYGHRGVNLKAKGWKIEAATQGRAKDGFHGLGGVSFTGSAGAISVVHLPDDQHTKVEVLYLQQPGGGTFTVRAGDAILGEVRTDNSVKQPGFAEFPLPAGTGQVELEVISGSARLFGYEFEKPGPGVVYSSLGLNGAQVQAVLRYFEPNQWTQALQNQHPDLVVVNYGTNESVFPSYIEKQYPSELRQVIERIKSALPGTSVLVMSPMDRGERDASGQIVTPPVLPRIVEIQRQVAAELGCAFFDTFHAMGGAGTMGLWYNSQPRLVSADFMHPLPGGAAKVGSLLDGALFQAYHQYETRSARELAHKRADRK